MKIIGYIPNLRYSELKNLVAVTTLTNDSNRKHLVKDENGLYPLNLQPEKYIVAFQNKYCQGIDYKPFYKTQEQENKEAQRAEIEKVKNEAKLSLVEYLKNAVEDRYLNYIIEFSKAGIKKEKSIKYAKDKALWIAIDEIATKTKIKTAFEAYLELNYSSKYRSYVNFYIKYKEFLERGILHAGIKNTNSKKLTTEHKYLIEQYASDPRKMPFSMIAGLVNIWAIKEGFKTVSESTVRVYLKEPEVWNRIVYYRDPKRFKNTIAPYQRRNKAEFACDLWYLDASPAQFYCIDNNNKLFRPNIFIIQDVHSGKIVGVDISKSEDFFNFKGAFYNAVKLSGCLPYEIVSDNASWTKRDEFNAMKTNMLKMGLNWNKTSVGNAKSKGNIERLFHTFNSQYERYFSGHIGDGILAHREGSRIDQDHSQKTHKAIGYPTFDEAKKLIIQLVSQYNEIDTSERKAPHKIFSACTKPNSIKVEPQDFALIFLNEKRLKVTRSSIAIEINKTKFEFEPYDNVERLKMTGKTVRVHYDETDMRSVFVFDLDSDLFIGEWKLCTRINQAIANQTDRDKELIIKGNSHNKAIETVVKKQASKMRDEIVAKHGKLIEPIDPFSYRKELINASEDSELKAMYELAEINPDKVQDRPQYIHKNEYNTIPVVKEKNRLHSKKFEKQTFFPVVTPKEPDEDEDL